jgi:hemoglobin
MSDKAVPTLYEWIGGMPAIEKLMSRFYEGVSQDDLLRDLFAGMAPDHPHRVSLFVAEVLGGPCQYSNERGGHATMVRKHVGKPITEEKRQRWVQLLLSTADEVGVPSDPEFRSALVAYLEWGSRLAVANAGLPEDVALDPKTPMPKWGWGVPGGPYRP